MVKTGEWLSEAWSIVQQDLWAHVLIFLVVGLVSSIPLLGPAMMAGYIMIVLRKLRNPAYTPAVGEVFEGFQLFVPALLVGIVGGIIANLGLIACIVGVFATTALVMFAMPLVVDRKLDFWPAIQESMDKVKPNLFPWSMFVLLVGLVYMLGAVLCGVGILVTGPIAVVALMIAYRETFGLSGEAAVGPAAPQAPYVPPTPQVPPTPTEPPSPTPPPSVPS